MRHVRIVWGMVFLSAVGAVAQEAQRRVPVPPLVTYSGALRDAGGKPLGGPQALTFSIYADSTSQAPLWQETQSISADEQGRYTAHLGSATAHGMPLDLFTSGQSLWLGVQPQTAGAPEQTRVLLVSVPYALKAADAETLGGRPASAYALAAVETSAPAGGASEHMAAAAAQIGVTSSCGSLTADGTSAARQIGIYSGPCALTEDTNFVDVGGKIGVGTGAPVAALDVRSTQTATSGTLLGGQTLATFNPSANSTATNVGSLVQAGVSSGNPANLNLVLAEEFLANHQGSGTVSTMEGMQGKVFNQGPGTVHAAEGVYSELRNTSGGTIDSGYGVMIAPPQNSGGGVFSNFYGLYVSTPLAAAKNYAIYSAGGTNYFAGNVGIGTTTPAAKLEVNGTAKFDGLVTFASGQKFPGGGGGGGGTITGVTAGPDLTGGGTSGNVTLGVDTAKVPELAALNLFTRLQRIEPSQAEVGLDVHAGDGASGIVAYGGADSSQSGGYAGPGMQAAGGDSTSGHGGAGITANGAYGLLGGGAGVLAYGANTYGDAPPGYGLYAVAGTNGEAGTVGYSAYLVGPAYITHSGNYSVPQLELYQGMSSGFSRVRFSQTGVSEYWDVAAGGGSSSAMSFYRSDVGNIMSLTPDPAATKLLVMSNGAYLTTGGAWTNSSDRNLKTDFREIRGTDVLRRLNEVPISEWRYKSEGTSVWHIGPTAQDFAAAFHLGSDDRHITTIDEGGVALAAIQELSRENQQLKHALAILQARVDHMRPATKRTARAHATRKPPAKRLALVNPTVPKQDAQLVLPAAAPISPGR